MVEGFFHFYHKPLIQSILNCCLERRLILIFSLAVELYGGEFVSIDDWDHFASTLLNDRNKSGLRVIEMVTNRDKNVKEHRDLWKYVSQEILKPTQGED